jgi:acyl carrier protein
LLSVVADKTGYPVEMLAAHMDLEADLGVDSIKRVEILSALRARAPQLPDVDASELGILRTVGEIAERLRPATTALAQHPSKNSEEPVQSGSGR